MAMKLLPWTPWRSAVGKKHTSKSQVMELTAKETQSLAEFRKRVDPVIPSYFEPDHELLRWLIARKFDVDKAEQMLLKSLEWRKKNDVDNIFSYEPPEVLTKYYGLGMTGFDKEGYPVWIVPYGSVDVKGILQSAAAEDYIKFTIQVMEKGPKIIGPKSADKRKSEQFRQSVIFDLENFSVRHFTWRPVIEVVEQIIQIYEANYPEYLRKAYVINAPLLFQVMYAAVKRFMASETTDKVQIYGSTGWKEAILKDIPADQLPVHFGGTMTDPDGDPKCRSMISYGGEVPKEYYLKNRKLKSSESKDGDFETLVLPSSGKKTFEFNVPDPGYHLSWEFETEDFDIGFGVTRIKDGSEQVIIPIQRVNSQLIPEEGTVVCTEPGIYKVTFDNEFSYIRSKNLRYKLKLLPPSDDDYTKF